MSATVTVTPESPRAGIDVCRVDIADADQNTDTGYDDTKYPASPEVRYYLTFDLDDVEMGRSYVFGVNSDGSHQFNNYIFPVDGEFTVNLRDVADDESVADSGAVTVQ